MYLRNQNIRDKAFDDQYKKRAEYEKIHGHIKGTVKFDIRRVRNQSRKLYSLLSFIAYIRVSGKKNRFLSQNPNFSSSLIFYFSLNDVFRYLYIL